MSGDGDDGLEKVRIKKVLGPTQSGTAVLLGNDEKTFVIYIGYYEGAALVRELKGEEAARPFTHELLSYVMAGFNIEVKRVIISDIINNTFCATLILEQRVVDEEEQWVGKRNEVRIDARPSDCIVIACKENKDIYCTEEVLANVRDVGEELKLAGGAGSEPDEASGETPDFLKEMFGDLDEPDPGSEEDED